MRTALTVRAATYGVLGFSLIATGTAAITKAPELSASSPTTESNHYLLDPRQAMLAALGAEHPHPSIANEARPFDRLVGTWDCDFTFYLDDGRVLRKKGELRFGWILDGRALQDIWITYPPDSTKERSIGTSVRFFDTNRKLWRVVFVGPEHNYLVNVEGGLEGDRIVLRGIDTDGAQIRWTFMDIKDDSFTWHGEKSRDGGETWKLEEEHQMRRRPA